MAKEPNLKSCCVSKRPHIIAKGLKGHFSPSKAYLLKGRLSSIYVLEETEIVKEESKTASLALFAGIGIATLMLFKRYVF
ncbi:MAG TPA: hypothetical protein PLC42_01775 [Parachlamydiaceae bacterium]|nr:hypothetical protein [Parachlamydiaceae bacterium]